MLNFKESRELFYYALPALSIALLGLPLYIYLPTFYADDVALGTFQVGLILFFARFLDVLSDPLIGYISDRFALRKSLMFVGALILFVGFYFLLHPPVHSSFLWLFSFSVITYFGWTMISIPYYALGSDIAQNYHQNTHYSSVRELFNIMGVLIALILPYAFGVANSAQGSLEIMFDTISIALPLTMIVFLLKVRHVEIKKSLLSLRDTYINISYNIKESKRLFLSFFLNSFANAIPATLFLFYVNLVIESPDYTGALLLLYFFSGILALPLWIYISKKWSKKTAWMLSMGSASFFFAFVPFLSQGDLLLFSLITLFSGFSLGADMALPASIQADVAQGASEESGGTLFGFFAMLVKLSLAFGVGLTFSLLGLVHFNAKAPTPESLFVLSLLYGLAPVVLKLSAIFVLCKYNEKAYIATK
ncbi:MAG: GPH family glycoside/pentoside/hexuronide:cation symporter [Sulfurimonas sp.]|jgi:GPH family glycoside/pentoside/hexuronide:cation symporter